MRHFIPAVVLTIAFAHAAAAQKPVGPRTPAPTPASAPSPSPSPDPLSQFLIPPELVMMHQTDIGLTDAQRATISKEAKDAQGKFIDFQWKMSSEMEKLTRLLSSAPVDEAQTLEELDRVLAVERDVKKTQITMMIRIKNMLTRDQLAKLDALRDHRDE